jgi:hypothetical protein
MPEIIIDAPNQEDANAIASVIQKDLIIKLLEEDEDIKKAIGSIVKECIRYDMSFDIEIKAW